jgi:hypothetical protein
MDTAGGEMLLGRGVLVTELEHGLPYGQGFLLVGHAAFDERFLPRCQAGDILDLVGENLDMADNADRRRVGGSYLRNQEQRYRG